MPTDVHAGELSARAATLRRLATRLEAAAPASLSSRAGEQTWIGPTADRCRGDVTAQLAAIRAGAADLRARARALEAQAAVAAALPMSGPV